MTRAYCVRCKEYVDASRVDPLEIACREHAPAFLPDEIRLRNMALKKKYQRARARRRKTA